MKKFIYAIGLISLPIIYIALMYIDNQKIDYRVLGLMLLILSPILLFGRRIGEVEKNFDSMTNRDRVEHVKYVCKKIAKNRF